MKITTSKGKTFDAGFIYTPVTDTKAMMIEYNDSRKLSKIAADWEDVQTITQEDEIRPNVTRVYEGYTVLKNVARNATENGVRVTLSMP